MKAANVVGKPRLMSMMTLLAVGFSLFIGWASVFEIDQGARAQGQVIALSRTQVIQAVDGGVLSELRVVEGQEVKVGQILAVLEKSRARAGYEENRARAAALRIALIRAKAESTLSVPAFGSEFVMYGDFVRAQRQLYVQHKRSLDEEMLSSDQALALANEELRMTDVLFKNGDVSKLEMLRAQRAVTDLVGRIASVRNKYRQDAATEVVKTVEELSSLNSKLAERQDVLDHTDLTAPVSGVVKLLRVTTIGGVLKAGDELMQIAPTEKDLIVEAKVNPTDVGLLRIGLPVTVKADAFDYSIYGTLIGELTYISPDTLSEPGPNGGAAQTYYRVHVKLAARQPQNRKAKEIVLKPGMTASIDIRTGTRTVLNYLAKPVTKAFGGALIER